MRRLAGNVAIGQMGGPTPVVNASLVGVLQRLERHGFRGRAYMPVGGVKGFVDGRFNVLAEPLSRLPVDAEKLKRTPGSDAFSSRMKADEEKCIIILERCRQLDIHYLFLIGGNDTAETAQSIDAATKAAGYELFVFHIPKTIDCDLRNNDHTPGYPSAATAAANFVARLNYESRSMSAIEIVVLMGRESSYLSLATAFAKNGDPAKAPHLIYPCEVLFDADRFIEDLRAAYARAGGGIVVVVSEGIRVPNGQGTVLFFEKLAEEFGLPVERDSYGNIRIDDLMLATGLGRLVRSRLGRTGLRLSVDVPNYLLRCAEATELDVQEAYRAGTEAVDIVIQQQRPSGSVTLQRRSSRPYALSLEIADLTSMAGAASRAPPEFINTDGNYPSEAFMEWARPLMGPVFRGTELPRTIVTL